MNWDDFYIGLAKYVATKSKDPSTRVGAVIVRPDKTVSSIGFNGFPRNIVDDKTRLDDRALKYQLIVHAELNAILNAREPLKGHTIYCSLPPCGECAKAIIQAGICRVITAPASEEQLNRWGGSIVIAQQLLNEATVEYHVADL